MNIVTPSHADLNSARTSLVSQFLVLSYFVTLANSFGYLAKARGESLAAAGYLMAVFLTYTLFYLSPAILITILADRLLRERADGRIRFSLSRTRANQVVFATAVASTTIIHVLILIDKTIFGLFGMHYNGFIWNVVFTKGGLESMGGGTDTTMTYVGIMAIYLAIQIGLLLVLHYVGSVQRVWPIVLTKRIKIASAVFLAAGAVGERITFGVSSLVQYSPVLASANVFPFYHPTTFYHLATKLGFDVKRPEHFKIKDAPLHLDYPLVPLSTHEPDQPYNIVWLVSESLRADMLDAEIMPNTWEFAANAYRFANHYSGGNGTRMGMFSMFYGLYGNYWFPFLRENRSPVLMDLIQERGYQLDMFTSAKFTYPEFDRTIFARVPSDRLHERDETLGWQRDRANVKDLLDFIDTRDPAKPFMTFMFFESPHARYYFPPESVIRTPYLEDFNYATMNLERDIQLIKNRYINSCHHLDSQLGRIFDHLEREGLLDSTIVLVTGDHGEEFMEKGRWGHNSEFTEEQIRAPLVLWVPGKGQRVVTDVTSHLDIAPTILRLLGVENPEEDFSQGIDLFSGRSREFTIIADWSRVCYRDDDYKAVFPLKMNRLAQDRVTTAQDTEIADPKAFYDQHSDRMLQLVRDLTRFSR